MDGTIDCIHLVVTVLDRMGIEHPPITSEMYEASNRQVARWVLQWGRRAQSPFYDGDVLLAGQGSSSFAVVWQNGVLSINPHSEQVNWGPVSIFTGYPCFRTRGN